MNTERLKRLCGSFGVSSGEQAAAQPEDRGPKHRRTQQPAPGRGDDVRPVAVVEGNTGHVYAQEPLCVVVNVIVIIIDWKLFFYKKTENQAEQSS